MATLLPLRYPVDLTGVSPDNLIIDEPHAPVRRKVRCIAPMYAPFFRDSLKIYDGVNPVPLNESQYVLQNLIPLPTAMTGMTKEVYAIIAITDQAVGDNLTLDYQTAGGEYVQSYEAALQLLEALTTDSRPATWPNVINRPLTYPPALHLHAVGDSIGWEYAAVALQQIREAIINGDAKGHDTILTYIDTQTTALQALVAQQLLAGRPMGDHLSNTGNPHNVTKEQVGLGFVQNFPVATEQEARDGTALNRYMTPSLVAKAIENIGSVSIGNHPSNTNNPHQTTKAQVGLGLVPNYPPSTVQQGTAGTNDASLMTPLSTKAAIDAAVASVGNVGAAHIARTDNPHGVTKNQVGLGNVQNYATATVAQTKTGTATNLYVTPAGVKGVIDDVKTAQTAALTAHTGNTTNPHAVTKAQVGLSLVENYPPASNAEGAAGTAANRYMTPASNKALLTAMAIDLSGKLDAALVGAPNGVAPLGGDSLIAQEYLLNAPGSNVRDITFSGHATTFDSGGTPIDPPVNYTMHQAVVARPLSWAALWAGSVAYCAVAPNANVVITIKRNTDTIGTITFLSGQKTGTFTGVAGTAVVGDVISLHYDPVAANTIRDIVLSLLATAYVP